MGVICIPARTWLNAFLGRKQVTTDQVAAVCRILPHSQHGTVYTQSPKLWLPPSIRQEAASYDGMFATIVTEDPERAMRWFVRHGFVEQALRVALTSGLRVFDVRR
jgi:hypothetical protein